MDRQGTITPRRHRRDLCTHPPKLAPLILKGWYKLEHISHPGNSTTANSRVGEQLEDPVICYYCIFCIIFPSAIFDLKKNPVYSTCIREGVAQKKVPNYMNVYYM